MNIVYVNFCFYYYYYCCYFIITQLVLLLEIGRTIIRLCVWRILWIVCAQNQCTIHLLDINFIPALATKSGAGLGHFTIKAVGGFAMFAEKPTIVGTPLLIIAVYTEEIQFVQFVELSSRASTQCAVIW